MNSQGSSPADPFTAFWTDMWSKMAAGGAQMPAPQPDMLNAMRKSFFEAMAKYADEFMRSEAFLQMMKLSVDNAMIWQQMMDKYLHGNVAALQMPTRGDVEQLLPLLRGMEQRLTERLNELSQRVENLEAAPAARKPAKTARE
jgi:hypothetical protein